jgi:hypothetical protein
MAHDDEIDPEAEVGETPPDALERVENDDDEAVRLDAYDLDDDGKISLVEDARANLGVVDAQLEALADEPGLKGRLANAAHKITDKLDND